MFVVRIAQAKPEDMYTTAPQRHPLSVIFSLKTILKLAFISRLSWPAKTPTAGGRFCCFTPGLVASGVDACFHPFLGGCIR